MLAACTVFCLGCAPWRAVDTSRPVRYAASWDQFFVDTYANPRQVSILRLGAGEARRAEYWVFEWVDEGQRLRPLYKSTLRNEWVPWSWRAEGDGRFLVTFDDRFEPQGSTENCVVIYDFVRGVTIAKRADDFLPAQWLRTASDRAQWDGGPAYVDPLLHVIFTTTPARARDSVHPFVVLDLPSLSVGVAPAPDAIPARAYCETSNAHAWEWTVSTGGAPEPSWLATFLLPARLRGKRVQPLDDSLAFGPIADEVHFRLDPATGNYERCSAEGWHEPTPNASP